MKKLVFSLMVCATLTAQAEELNSFASVAEAASQGKQITLVWHADQCTAAMPLPDVYTSIKPNAVMVIKNQIITASDLHFTLNDPSLPGVPTFGYSKFELLTDGSSNIKITLMKAADYSKVAEYKIQCMLGKGLFVFSN